jgi:hypothetical protein
LEEVPQVLKDPAANLIVNASGIAGPERTKYITDLLNLLETMRVKDGRPHWIVADEARPWMPLLASKRVVFVTTHPEEVSKEVLESADLVLACGNTPAKILSAFATKLGVVPPVIDDVKLQDGEVVAWPRSGNQGAFVLSSAPRKE